MRSAYWQVREGVCDDATAAARVVQPHRFQPEVPAGHVAVPVQQMLCQVPMSVGSPEIIGGLFIG